MEISSLYICPSRGLDELRSPDPDRLGETARTAGDLGVDRLIVPVLEESLIQPPKARNRFFDDLVRTLDAATDAGLGVRLLAPAQRLLGLDWIPPYLAKAGPDPAAPRVFTAGKTRNLRPFDWWKDPAIIGRRLRVFRELVSAVTGHPALAGWIVLDGLWSWAPPSPEAADILMRGHIAEIRERDPGAKVWVSLPWTALLDQPGIPAVIRQADGIRLTGLDRPPEGLPEAEGLAGNVRLAAYLGALGRRLFGLPVEIETGWGDPEAEDPETVLESVVRFTGLGLDGISWANLVRPGPGTSIRPPWGAGPGLDRIGLLRRPDEPVRDAETWLAALKSGRAKEGADDFFDLSVEEFNEDPATHLVRLWDHFRE